MSNKDQTPVAETPTLQPGKSIVAEVAGLQLRFTRQSPALVTVTDEDQGERFVANVAMATSPVVYPNWAYRQQFGAGQLDRHGAEARRDLVRLAQGVPAE